jgi:outer membrane protein OmpA-like peptidoglycan-associated protein
VEIPKPVIRKPITSTIGGFQSGSAVVTPAMKESIAKLISRRSNFKVVNVTGFLGGAAQNSALSKLRAANVIKYMKSISKTKYLYSPAKARSASAPKTSSGGVQIVFRDK